MYRNARTIRVRNQGFVQLAILAIAGVLFPGEAIAQIGPLHLVAEPAAVEVLVGQSVPLSVQVLDASGQPVNVAVRIAAPRGALRVRDGRVQGLAAGTYVRFVIDGVPPEFVQHFRATHPLLAGVPIRSSWFVPCI